MSLFRQELLSRKYRKKKQINELKPNEQVNDIFVVRFKKPVEKTKNGKKKNRKDGTY